MGEFSLFNGTVKPDDCALLIAPPLNIISFEKDVMMARASIPAREARGDYAFQMTKAQTNMDTKTAWEKDGKIVASLCQNLIFDANSVNVKVYDNATSKGLVKASYDGASVIVLVAHWRSSRVSDTDLRIEALPTALESIQTSTDSFEMNLTQRLSPLLFDSGTLPRKSVIANLISSVICEEAGYPNTRPTDEFMSAPHRESEIGKVRDRIDLLFPDLLVPGNCLELRDGYYKASAIAKMFPDDWSGIVELAVCHSLYLANAIKSGRDDRRILTNELAKHPERCLPELQETFLRLSIHEQNYIELRLKVFAAYSQGLSSFN